MSSAFVDQMRADGQPADVLDPLTDDLDDPERPGTPYDGVYASACLLHVGRADLPTVLQRLAAATRPATRPGGILMASLKEGDGETWSAHGPVSAPRRFVLWREHPLREALEGAGWQVREIQRREGLRGEHWLVATAMRG